MQNCPYNGCSVNNVDHQHHTYCGSEIRTLINVMHPRCGKRSPLRVIMDNALIRSHIIEYLKRQYISVQTHDGERHNAIIGIRDWTLVIYTEMPTADLHGISLYVLVFSKCEDRFLFTVVATDSHLSLLSLHLTDAVKIDMSIPLSNPNSNIHAALDHLVIHLQVMKYQQSLFPPKDILTSMLIPVVATWKAELQSNACKLCSNAFAWHLLQRIPNDVYPL